MDGVAVWHPQTAYVELQNSLQKEWDFLQRVTPGIWTAFYTMEDDLCDELLPALFKGDTSQIPMIAVTGLTVKQAGIALPGHTQTVGTNWMESCVITGHLVAELRGTDEFRARVCALLMIEGRGNIHRRHAEDAEMALGEAQAAASMADAFQMVRIMQAGAWLLVLPSTVNGTELGEQDWRGSLFLCYGIEPPDLLGYCDGYGAEFSICHDI